MVIQRGGIVNQKKIQGSNYGYRQGLGYSHEKETEIG